MQPDRMVNDRINDIVNALLRARGLTLREQLRALRDAEDQIVMLRELVAAIEGVSVLRVE